MASTTPLYQRVGTFILAVLFAASTVGIVVYYVVADRNQRKEQEALKAITQQQSNNKENSLKGKQLQNFTPEADIPELKTITLSEGSGDAVVKESDTVTVNYTGAIASTGVIFESSLDTGQAATFPLNGVIAGWTKGLPGMKVGETRRLLIPSDMAYGSSGSGTIPANSDLVFDVTLVAIK
jgi:FKBP-type peptidyl-prolyl cis-trans isomerase